MKLKFRDDYPLDKIDLMQGEFRATWERSQQPFEVNDHLGESLLRTTYPYRVDQPNGRFKFEDQLVFEQVAVEALTAEAPTAEASKNDRRK